DPPGGSGSSRRPGCDGTWSAPMSPHFEARGSEHFFSRILAACPARRRTSMWRTSRVAVGAPGVSPMTELPLPEESIFAQALEIKSRTERAAFLDRVCGDNQALRAEVEALLRAQDRSGDVLDLPKNALAASVHLAETHMNLGQVS